MKRLVDTLIGLDLAGASLAVLLLMTEERRLLPVALALIALPWPLRLWRQRRLTLRTPLDGPLALFLLTASVGVWAAYDRILAWPRFWLILGSIALYYALANQQIANRQVGKSANRKSQISKSANQQISESANRQSHIASLQYPISSIQYPMGLWSLGLCAFAAVLGVYFVTQHDWAAEPGKFAAITRLGTWIATHTPRLPGPYIHPNVLGGALAVVWPINLALVVAGRRPQAASGESHVAGRRSPECVSRFTFYVSRFTFYVSRFTHHASHIALFPCFLVSLSTLVLTTFALLMTGSRGAWLALGVAGGLWLLGRLRQRWLRLADALAVLAIAAALTLLLSPAVADRLSAGGLTDWLANIPVGSTALNRFDLYRQALTLLRDYPFTGLGLGCFPMVYSTYVLLLHVLFITHAHNLFLQLAIEQGIFGLLAFVWLLGAFFWSQGASRRAQVAGRESHFAFLRLRSGQVRAPQSAIGNAAMWSVVVIVVHGLVDATLYASRTLPFLFVPFGLAVARQRGREAERQRGNEAANRQSALRIPSAPLRTGTHYVLRITHYALPALLLACILLWRRPLLGLVFSNLGAVWQTQAELSVYKWPKYPLQDAVRREHRDVLLPAMAAFSRALSWDAGNVTAHQRLGQLHLAWGDYAAALAHLQAAWGGANPHSFGSAQDRSALRISQWTALRQLLGEALIVNGRVEEGAALWSTLENSQEQLGLRAYWYNLIGDPERAAWLRQAAESR